jgi:hypothetical protein
MRGIPLSGCTRSLRGIGRGAAPAPVLRPGTARHAVGLPPVAAPQVCLIHRNDAVATDPRPPQARDLSHYSRGPTARGLRWAGAKDARAAARR